MAYLAAYQSCGDEWLLDAAKETADALIRTQFVSGGWDSHIEFDPQERTKYAYRVDAAQVGKRRRNTTTFDDNKTQSATTFLMRLDQQLNFKNDRLHEAVTYALDAAIKAQYANGAWPQRYNGSSDSDSDDSRKQTQPVKASFPKTWPRSYPKEKYDHFYTLNDDTISDLIAMMLDAWEIYGDDRYLESALRGGDFLLLAQLPEPQPGWAQQYDRKMQPAWARKFEPPAITGSESQAAMRTLMLLYRRTAAKTQNADRFLQPIPRAIEYYRSSLLDDGKLARFYELGSNRPLFFTRDYELTYSSDDVPTHYAFIVSSKLDSIESELKRIRKTPIDQLWKPQTRSSVKQSAELTKRVRRLIASQDDRGAWVESGRLKKYGQDDPTTQVIRSKTFAANIQTLAQWLGK